MKIYDITTYYQTSKTLKVRAPDRQQAIEKAARIMRDRGIEAISFKVPYLEGDE